MTLGYAHTRDARDTAQYLIDFVYSQTRIDPLRKIVERQRDQINIPRPLTVAEDRPLYPLRPCQYRQLRTRDRASSVIVGMNADDDALSVFDVFRHPLYTVGIDVG